MPVYHLNNDSKSLVIEGGLEVQGDIYAGLNLNYTKLASNGDITFNGTAGFYPVRISQSAQPTPDTGELVVWHDTDDNKIYLVYNDTVSGVMQVELV